MLAGLLPAHNSFSCACYRGARSWLGRSSGTPILSAPFSFLWKVLREEKTRPVGCNFASSSQRDRELVIVAKHAPAVGGRLPFRKGRSRVRFPPGVLLRRLPLFAVYGIWNSITSVSLLSVFFVGCSFFCRRKQHRPRPRGEPRRIVRYRFQDEPLLLFRDRNAEVLVYQKIGFLPRTTLTDTKRFHAFGWTSSLVAPVTHRLYFKGFVIISMIVSACWTATINAKNSPVQLWNSSGLYRKRYDPMGVPRAADAAVSSLH